MSLFRVTEKRRKMRVEWILEDGLWSFFILAHEQGAEYALLAPFRRTAPRAALIEIEAIRGCWGEYKRGLYWDGSGGLYREFNSTHYLAQHGLDSYPKRIVNYLITNKPDEQIFRVEARGVFTLSITEWLHYFGSGEDFVRLTDMAITKKSIKQTQGRLL